MILSQSDFFDIFKPSNQVMQDELIQRTFEKSKIDSKTLMYVKELF